MDNTSAGPHYVAFILRCWQEEQTTVDQQSLWRFSLEEIGPDHPRVGFNQLEDVFLFLQKSLSEPSNVWTERF